MAMTPSEPAANPMNAANSCLRMCPFSLKFLCQQSETKPTTRRMISTVCVPAQLRAIIREKYKRYLKRTGNLLRLPPRVGARKI
jgi:hypothetical protein